MATDTIQAGREAAARYSWGEALEYFSDADLTTPLGPDDLDALGEALWWLGRMRDCIAAHERAHESYLRAGNGRRAARMALKLADHHADLLEMPVAMAWLQRAGKFLENEPDCLERGYLQLTFGMVAHRTGRPDDAVAPLEAAMEIGTRFGDKDIVALSLGAQGGVYVNRGEVDRGMALLDEATIAAVSGELGPFATGWIYCMMISICAGQADWQRAGQWTEAAKRWCDRQSISGFPGVCRVHRAEIMRLRGSMADAEEEARAATTELGQFNLVISGWAFYELGEIRLRVGDFDAAEQAFRQAHGLGRDPQPGLSMLQLKRGKKQAAASAIKRALDEAGSPLDRAKLLPAHIEIALASGDPTAARTSAEELAQIATAYTSPAMQAAAEAADATVSFAEGEFAAAESAAKRARKLWQQADIPYEAARLSMLLAEIYAAEGDADAAELELRSAQAVFDKLGAGPDSAGVAERLRSLSASSAPAGHRIARTFMFTDIVKSTNLLEAIGDDAWTDLIRWHDETLRALFAAHGGEEVDDTGDGFFVAFENADGAVACATAVQRALAEHRRAHGFAPQVRIGLHATDAVQVGENYRGKGVHEAARIGALAEGGEILASALTADCVSTGRVSEPRLVNLKGVAEPVSVVSVLWRDA